MLDHFLVGLRQVPNLEVKKIYLEDVPMAHYNFANSQGPLPEEASFRALTDELRDQATGLVIATPTYNFSVPAQLKNFIDRMRFIALDMKARNRLGQPVGQLRHLKTYFLVSGGTPTWAQRILFFAFPPFWLRGVFLYFGAQVIGAYYSGDVRAKDNQKILAACERRGRRYGEWISADHGNRFLERLFWRPPQRDN